MGVHALGVFPLSLECIIRLSRYRVDFFRHSALMSAVVKCESTVPSCRANSIRLRVIGDQKQTGEATGLCQTTVGTNDITYVNNSLGLINF